MQSCMSSETFPVRNFTRVIIKSVDKPLVASTRNIQCIVILHDDIFKYHNFSPNLQSLHHTAVQKPFFKLSKINDFSTRIVVYNSHSRQDNLIRTSIARTPKEFLTSLFFCSSFFAPCSQFGGFPFVQSPCLTVTASIKWAVLLFKLITPEFISPPSANEISTDWSLKNMTK